MESFDSISELGRYILESDLKATERRNNKVTLCNNSSDNFVEHVLVTFE